MVALIILKKNYTIIITKISVINYKSIFYHSIELSNVNVLIGKNGSGKSNYLEAVAMLSAVRSDRLNINGLLDKGARATKPNLTMNSFLEKRPKAGIEIDTIFTPSEKEHKIKCKFAPLQEDGIYSEWKNVNVFTIKEPQIQGDIKKSLKNSYICALISADYE